MFTLAPSVFAADHNSLIDQVYLLKQCGITCLHVDIMDGRFVPLKAFGPETVLDLKKNTDMKLDVHLMIEEPEKMVSTYAQAGADAITVHYEACSEIAGTLDEIHAFGLWAGIALKPSTDVKDIPKAIWEHLDILHIMTTQPGRPGQIFIPEMLEKIAESAALIRSKGRNIQIEVDGDITKERLKPVLKAGAGIVVVGKAIFQGNIRQNVQDCLQYCF